MAEPTTKAAWRSHFKERRVEVDAAAAGALQANLIRVLRPIGGLLLFYRSMAGEVPLEPVADELGWARFCVTRTPDDGPLTIHPAVGAMEQHRYGFAQPVEGAMELPPHHLSAVVVPGVAFDRRGNRLGHGAGYYDELLSRVPADRPRIGVALEEFVVDELPVEPHDISMTHLVTEQDIAELI